MWTPFLGLFNHETKHYLTHSEIHDLSDFARKEDINLMFQFRKVVSYLLR
jgi:hypothetical protein